MFSEATAMTVRKNLGELLNEVQYRHNRVLITRAGKPVAALVDVEIYERINKFDAEFDRLSDRLADAFSGLPEEQGVALLDEAVKHARRER
jgi:prevent-host-death family protein